MNTREAIVKTLDEDDSWLGLDEIGFTYDLEHAADVMLAALRVHAESIMDELVEAAMQHFAMSWGDAPDVIRSVLAALLSPDTDEGQ